MTKLIDQKVKESNLWKWLREGIKKSTFSKRIGLERVENGCGSGTPDVDGMLGVYTAFKLELKTAARPVRATSKVQVKVEPTQPPWHRKWWNKGASTWALIQVGGRAGAKRYLIPGNMLDRIASGVTESDLALMSVNDPRCSPEAIVVIAAYYRRKETPMNNLSIRETFTKGLKGS